MEIHFEIENRCMLKCRHCSSYAEADGKKKEYSTKAMIHFLEQLHEKKSVFFTGGEPLLCEDIEDILLEIDTCTKDVEVGFFTTGIMEKDNVCCSISREYAKRLYELGLRTCYVSIYSACAEEHDWMTKQPGSFVMSMQSIKNMVSQGIEIRFNLVITKKNYLYLNEIIELASEWKCKEVRLLKLIKHGRAYECWDDIGISDAEYRNVVSDLLGKPQNVRITVSGCPDIAPCRPFMDAEGCQAGSQLLYVTYEGNIFPCACVKNNIDYVMGKIEDAQFSENYYKKLRFSNNKYLCKR